MSNSLQLDQNADKADDVKESASIIGGGLLMIYGIMRRDLIGVLCTIGGAGMILTCAAKRTAGTWTAVTSVEKFPVPLMGNRTEKKIKCKRAITIAKPIDVVFGFLSDPRNYPQFMHDVQTISALADNGYKWQVKNLAGGLISWNTTMVKSDITKEVTFTSQLDAEAGGTIKLTCLPINKARDSKEATEVHVELDYFRPNLKMVATVFHLIGKDPAQQMEADMAALKQLLEAGEIATNHA
jgi:uncharacterized membrane protein